MIDAAISSNRMIVSGDCRKGIVLVKDGKIVDIVNDMPIGDFAITDVGDNVLMAGIVDTHVHINEPGRTEWEGFDTATKAALAGGITTLVDMPLNASPVTTTANALDIKMQATANQLHTNCGFWGGLVPNNFLDIEPLIQKGVVGFKAFLTHSGIDEFPNVAEADLRKAMPILAKYNLPLLVHCELDTPIQTSPKNTNSDNKVYANYLASRPKSWEDDAIAMMIRLCEEFNCKTHIVHLSSATSIAQIEMAKQKGLPLTVETGQQYLYFNAEDIGDGKTEFKCAPPIREKENNEQLWQALKNGVIDFVATDHSPAPPNLKEIQSGNFMKAWGGISSIQYALPVLWTAALKHNCTITDMAKWLCEKPALLANLNNKGKIEKGCDADFVVWNPEEKFIVTENNMYHKHKISPYLNETLSGVVKQTWLAGKKVYNENNFLHLNNGQLLLKN